jgi:hypothetical protein
MTAVAQPARDASSDAALQQLLMRLTGTLNRRRAYASTHPMVLSSEEQLLGSIANILDSRPVLSLGVARTDLLVDGARYESKSSYARELATRLHRRGVGAMTFKVGVTLDELRTVMRWLATEPVASDANDDDAAPMLVHIGVTRVAYDQLILGEADRAAEASGTKLWHALAQLAADLVPGYSHAPALVAGTRSGDASKAADTPDPDAIVASLHRAVGNPEVARRTAVALMDLASQGVAASPELRARIGEQLFSAMSRLGDSSFSPIIKGLGERATRQQFVSQVVDVLPIAAVANWLKIAAMAEEQQLSHHMLRLMSKLSTYAEEKHDDSAETVFRGAAQELVRGWELEDPNPEEHVALLDRIAMHERIQRGEADAPARSMGAIESSRLVQMALEIDVAGDDARAAAEALVLNGDGAELMQWTLAAGETSAAVQLRRIATSAIAVKQLLLREPVDRLEARALLDRLDVDSCGTLLDVLEGAEARGTRMIVRQRLAEFGANITPQLLARLDGSPWYLVRNILTLLQEVSQSVSAAAAGTGPIAKLLDHAQVQVRIEALRLLVLDAGARDGAIRHALRDDQERVVLLALQSMTEAHDAAPSGTMSDVLASELMALVDSGKHSSTVRARVIRALGLTRNDKVRDWMLGLVTRKTRILRRSTLTQPTVLSVAALRVLERVYGTDPSVEPVISLTRREGQDPRWHAQDPTSAGRDTPT